MPGLANYAIIYKRAFLLLKIIPPLTPSLNKPIMFLHKYLYRHILSIAYDDHHFPVVLNADLDGVYSLGKKMQRKSELGPIISPPSPYSRPISTVINLPSTLTMHGTIAPDHYLYTPDWGTFFIYSYIGIMWNSQIQIRAVQPNGQEATIDIPLDWVHLSWVWTWQKWKCYVTGYGYIKEEKLPI